MIITTIIRRTPILMTNPAPNRPAKTEMACVVGSVQERVECRQHLHTHFMRENLFTQLIALMQYLDLLYTVYSCLH